MTTIAYRNGMIAADSAMLSGSALSGEIVKIARRKDGALAGAAGDAAYCSLFLGWFRRGERGRGPVAREGQNWIDRAAIIRRDRTIEIFEPHGTFACQAPYYALGSGKEFALGAMFAGADAETAVRAAVAHDPYTDGRILVMRAEG